MDDFEDAKEKVMLGPERRSRVFTDEVKKEVAYHEAGHAVVAHYCDEADPVHKVTIIPRGQALGLTAMLPEEDQYTISEQKYLDQICVALGGRVAEDIFLGKIGSGAYGDIRAVTNYARTMVTRLGMSEKLGPIAFEEGAEQVFLGRDFGRQHVFSERTLREIDDEINRIVMTQFARARDILETHREKVETLTAALLERETLDAGEFKLVMEGKELPEVEIEIDHSTDEGGTPDVPPSDPDPEPEPPRRADPGPEPV
jgi:cell division protease FtsH